MSDANARFAAKLAARAAGSVEVKTYPASPEEQRFYSKLEVHMSDIRNGVRPGGAAPVVSVAEEKPAEKKPDARK